MESPRDRLLEAIIDVEQEMFCALNTGEDQCSEEKIKPFRLGRWMSFSALSDDFLFAYRAALEIARQNGRNLLTEKYAMMDGQIPMPPDDPQLNEIVRQECNWMHQLSEKYPHVIKQDKEKASFFEHYTKCELSTYSRESIQAMHRDVIEAAERGINLAEKRYDNLYERLGHGSLRAQEEASAA